MDEKSPCPEEQRSSAGSIVEEHAFRQRLQELRISHKTLDEIIGDYPLSLALRSPEVYPNVPETNIRRIRIQAGCNHPALNIWIEYDGEVVKLVDIDLVDGQGR